MKPEELGCFEQVKAILGKQGAIEELQKVIDSDLTEWHNHENEDVMGVFTWEYSPQGFDFWLHVHEGAVPRDYTPMDEAKQVYVCSLNDDILVGTREQLLDLMVEQGWTLCDFVNMTTYELGNEVELELTIKYLCAPS